MSATTATPLATPLAAPPRAAPALPLVARRGVVFVAVAQACLVLDGMAVHHLGPAVAPAQITLLRALGSALLLALLLGVGRERLGDALRTPRPGLQVLRGALSVAPLWLIFWGFARAPLGEATALDATLPVSMALFGALLLRERVTPAGLAAVARGRAGAALVAGGGFGGGAWDWAHAAVLAGAALDALAVVASRALSLREGRPVTILAWLTLVGLGLSLPGALAAGPMTLPREEWPALLALAAAGTGAVRFTLLAVRACDVSALAPHGGLRRPVAMLVGLLVFGEVPATAAPAGAALILLAGLLPWLLSPRPGTPRSPAAARGG